MKPHSKPRQMLGRPDPLLEIASLASLKYSSNPHPPLARQTKQLRRMTSLTSDSSTIESEPSAFRAREQQFQALKQDAPEISGKPAILPLVSTTSHLDPTILAHQKAQKLPAHDLGLADKEKPSPSPPNSPKTKTSNSRPQSVRGRDAVLHPIKPTAKSEQPSSITSSTTEQLQQQKPMSSAMMSSAAQSTNRPRGSARRGSARVTDSRSPRAHREILARQERDKERVKTSENEVSATAAAVSSNFVPLTNMEAFMECVGVLSTVHESMDQLLNVAQEALGKFLSATKVSFYWSSNGNLISIREKGPTFPVTRGIIGDVATTGKLANIKAAKLHPRFDAEVDGNAESVLAIPIASFSGTKSISGVLALIDKKEQPTAGFSTEDESAIKLLVPFLVSSARNTRAIVRRQSLLEAGREISAELEVPHLYALICEKAALLFQCELARIILIDSATGDFFLAPISDSAEDPKPINDRKSIAAHVITTGEVVSIPTDPTTHPQWSASVDQPQTLKNVKNLVVWPIVNSKNMMGAIELYNLHGTTAFSTDDDIMLKSFTLQISEAIQNAGVLGKTLAGYQAAMSTQLKYQALLQVAQSLAQHLESGGLVGQILQRARELVDAERSSLFLVDKSANELVSQVAEGTEDGIRCPLSQGVIGHVATTGDVLNIADAYSDPRFNVEIDKQTKFRTRNIICVPIKDSSDEIIGVTEIINKKQGAFTKEDEELLKAFSVFCGLALNNAKLYDEAITQQKKARALLDVVMALTGDNQVTPLLTTIMTRARELINADRAALFVLDPKNKELRTQVADGSGEIVLPTNPGSIAGFVASTGQDLAIADAYNDPRFNPGIDKQTGYQTHSVLAIPILNEKGEVIAVTEMINKQNGAAFKEEDRLLVKAFANFCGKSLTDLVSSYHSSRPTQVHYPIVTVTAMDKEAILSWNFNVNSYASHDDLIRMVVAMFEDFGLLEEFHVPMTKFLAFLHELSRSYNTVPYHNFSHAVDALQFMFLMMRTSDKLRKCLTRLEIFALMLAALEHDIDHGGLNNAFQVNAQTPLAMLFQNRSIMESYHVSRSIAIMSNESFDVLHGLTEQERQQLWSFLIGTILATDMASHFSLCAEFDALAKGKVQYESVQHHKLLGKMIMKSGDISNVCRPFDLAKEWAEILLKEFFRQGDIEKTKGLPMSPFMDRSHVVMAQMQLGFINSIALPMFESMTTFAPDLRSSITEVLTANSSRWASILADASAISQVTPTANTPSAINATTPGATNQSGAKKIAQHIVSQTEEQHRLEHGASDSSSSLK